MVRPAFEPLRRAGGGDGRDGGRGAGPPRLGEGGRCAL